MGVGVVRGEWTAVAWVADDDGGDVLAGLAMGPAMEPWAEGQSAGAAGTSCAGAPSGAGDKAAAGTVPGAPVPQASPKEKLAAIETLIARAHYDEALERLDAMAGEVPEAAGVERLKGMVYYQTGKLVEADTAFARALQQDPADQVATEMRGMVLFRTGRPAEAIPLLEKANTWLAKLNTDANYVLALSYLQTRRYDDARTVPGGGVWIWRGLGGGVFAGGAVVVPV